MRFAKRINGQANQMDHTGKDGRKISNQGSVNYGDSAIFRRLDFPLLGITAILFMLFFLPFTSLVKPILKDKSI